MNRAPLHGAPRGPRSAAPSYRPQDACGSRGPTPSYGHQDARGSRVTPPTYGSQDACANPGALSNQNASANFAVQPAANAGSMKLKKMAVKIVGATAPSKAVTPVMASSPKPEPVKVVPKEVERSVARVSPRTRS